MLFSDLSSEAYFLARQVKREPQKSFVRITKDLKEGLTLKADLEFFLDENLRQRLLFFPPHDNPPSPAILPSSDIIAERIATLEKILGGEPFVLVTSQKAFESQTISPELLRKNRKCFRLKEEILRKEFVSWLVEAGYNYETVVESPGDFAVRGSLIDIFPPQEEYPCRLEFEGDVLTEIRKFDPTTQVTLKNIEHRTQNIEQILLIPTTETFPDEKPATLADYLPPDAIRLDGPPSSSPIQTSAELKRQWNLAQLKEWLSQRLKVRLICHTPIQAERLKDLLRNQGFSDFPVEVGKLSSGFGILEEGLIFLTEEEIFGHKTIRPTKSTKAAAPFPSFLELRAEDTLVHEEHGLCRYKGLKHLKIRETTGDYLELEFLGKDKLFLPITRLNVVQKYIGAGTSPPLDSLRGFRWKKVRERAQKEIFKMALELLKVHAQRELQPGFAYPELDYLDEEFASQFPFDETPDQARSIEDVLRDMQNPKPMDRLICGDVGYGKTEVAMRAAFKAVGTGKQVAVIAPTTILALQHYETFLERFSKFKISVAMLSRFRSGKEQKETLSKLSQGEIEIVIGTHRLLVEDVLFKDLGLLIVDEEHRFGVRHKERIKKMRPTVDVLTLSATPIPRTLHMSLIGIKDLSIIHTPPVDRLAIRTFLAKWDEDLMKHAITQELARGGQVFFIHNRVMTIGGIYKRLQNLFPDVSIAVAHGQMKERELEKVMLDFLHQKTKVLITTAIVESGIDVPNANTMIIHQAEMLGLAQLYQLRGRVGRSDVQAYCYLMVSDEEVLTREAKERLSVLTRYTELGAGFQIASHDLEIRGSGNLLGTSQSGFIEEIGYELYTKLLAQTIRKLKGETVEEELNPEIQIKVPAFIPEKYIADSTLRMQCYKRLSHFKREEEMDAFGAELTDRFGPLPQEVRNLLEVVRLKQWAVRLKCKSIKAETLEEARKRLRKVVEYVRS